MSATAPARVRAPQRAYRLAAVDIDDTLVGPDGVVSAENAAAVATLVDRGVHVVLASGRSHANMLPFHAQLGLGAGPVVSSQGALVREAAPDGAVWQVAPIAPALVEALTRDGRARGCAVEQYRLDGVYLDTRTRWTEYDQSRNVDRQRLVPDLLAVGADDPVLKIIWLDDPDRIAATAPAAAARYAGTLVVTPTDPPYLEFTAPAVTKAEAVALVAARLGVARDEVLAFGDGNNDASMLAWAGLGVAMDHARPAAIAAADRVAPAGDPETALSRAVALALGEG